MNETNLAKAVSDLFKEIATTDGEVYDEIIARLHPKTKIKVRALVRKVHEELKICKDQTTT